MASKEKVTCRACKSKNEIVKMRERPTLVGLYTELCPNPINIKAEQMDTVVQMCKNCGYTNLRIDEDVCIDKKWIKSDE